MSLTAPTRLTQSYQHLFTDVNKAIAELQARNSGTYVVHKNTDSVFFLEVASTLAVACRRV
jgi:hypothetical protein